MLYLFQKHFGFIRLFLLRVIILQRFTLRLLISLLEKVFKSDKGIKQQIYYTKKIIMLSFKNDFDWRK
jgi:hypothetical protein